MGRAETEPGNLEIRALLQEVKQNPELGFQQEKHRKKATKVAATGRRVAEAAAGVRQLVEE